MGNVCDFQSHVCFINNEVYLQIARYEMAQSSCKRDTKSKSHPGMKLAPVRVFSCKDPLRRYVLHKAVSSFFAFFGVGTKFLKIK